MKVKDVMHKGVDWVSPNTPVTILAKMMREHDIGCIPIGEDDRLIGMVTDRDIVCKGLASNNFDAGRAMARDVMTEGIHCCRADDAERAKAQVKRHGGRLIWRFDDCHDVIPALRPEDVLHGHSKRLRHLLEGICPLRGILSVADSLVGELRKHDISYHGHPP